MSSLKHRHFPVREVNKFIAPCTTLSVDNRSVWLTQQPFSVSRLSDGLFIYLFNSNLELSVLVNA